jgi:hypothetical protein
MLNERDLEREREREREGESTVKMTIENMSVVKMTVDKILRSHRK